MRRKPPTVRDRILELLADGKERAALAIVSEVTNAYGFTRDTVANGLSGLAWNCRVVRRKDGASFAYRRIDVEAPAS